MRLGGLLVVVALLAACAGSETGAGGGSSSSTAPERATTTVPPTTTTEPVTTTTEPTTTTTTDPLLGVVEAMTVEQKIGQMLMPVVRGTGAEAVNATDRQYNQALGGADTPAELVRRFHLGGIMYLGPNVVSPAQIRDFGAGLQTVAAGSGMPPLLIAVDQEGGRVQRISGEGITPVGSARSLAGDAGVVRATAARLAEELRAIGVTVDFAPVADVVRSAGGVISDRSYGSDPAVVGAMVEAAVEGLQSSGVAAVVKHWPGHGATLVDSHRRLPVIETAESDWRAVDQAPFVDAVAAGVDAMMIGHLAMPALDPSGAPATLSPVMVDRYLRRELAYDGVLFSDALDMGALDGIEEGELAVQVVEAGLDVLLVPPDLRAAATAIAEAVASGRLDEERLDLSVVRILELKRRLGLALPGA